MSDVLTNTTNDSSINTDETKQTNEPIKNDTAQLTDTASVNQPSENGNQQQQQQPHILSPQELLDIEMKELNNQMNKSVPQLTEGLLLMTKIPLDALIMKLLELQKEQAVLLSLMSNENQKLQNIKNVDVIIDNFKKVSEYLIKVQAMKKEMSTVQDRMNKIKKRAINLKEKKQQHINNLNERVEKALQRERDLTVKPSPQLVQQQQQQQLQPQKPKHSLTTNVTL